MLKYAIRRIILMIPVLICVTLLLFFIQALAPGRSCRHGLGTGSD